MQVQVSRKAVSSLVLSLLGLLFWLPSIPAIILAQQAQREIKKSDYALGGRRVARLGLVIGYCGLFLYPLMLVTVTIPNLIAGTKARNELVAIETLRELESSLRNYASATGGYPSSLTQLSEKVPVSQNIIQKVHDGYEFTYTTTHAQVVPGTGRYLFSEYELHAEPLWRQRLFGGHYFYVDQSGVIRVRMGQRASDSSDPVE